MSSWVAGLLLLVLTAPSSRAANGDDSDEIRDKRRGPWQSQTKEAFGGGSRYPSRPWKHQKAPTGTNTVYLAQGKPGLRVPWGQRLVRDEASFAHDDSMVGPNARWGSARTTYAWRPTDEDDMIQRQGLRAKIKRLYTPFFEFITRMPQYNFIKQGNRDESRIGAVDKRYSPMSSLRRLQSSVPLKAASQNVMCDPTSADPNSDDCYE